MSLSKGMFSLMAAHRAKLIDRQEQVLALKKQYQAMALKFRREGSEKVAEIFEATWVRYCEDDLEETQLIIDALEDMQLDILTAVQEFEAAEEFAHG